MNRKKLSVSKHFLSAFVIGFAVLFSLNASAAGFQMRVQKPGLKAEPPKVEEPAPIEGRIVISVIGAQRMQANMMSWSDLVVSIDPSAGQVFASSNYERNCPASSCATAVTFLRSRWNEQQGIQPPDYVPGVIVRDDGEPGTGRSSGEFKVAQPLLPGSYQFWTNNWNVIFTVDSDGRFVPSSFSARYYDDSGLLVDATNDGVWSVNM